MTRILAALALACVYSPAMAGAGRIEGMPATGGFAHGLAFGLLLLGALALAVAVCLAARARLPVLGVAIAALIALIAGPALAAEVATGGDTAVILPWGQWVTAIAQTATEILIPVIIAAVGVAARHLPWYLQMWFTTQRIDRMVRLAADYALNAVEGATAGKAASIDVGHPLLKAGLERALGSSPQWLIDAAGGTKGITERLFRAFHFDETVTDANTLTPFLAGLPASAK